MVLVNASAGSKRVLYHDAAQQNTQPGRAKSGAPVSQHVTVGKDQSKGIRFGLDRLLALGGKVTISIIPMSQDDRCAVIDIFNYYVENTFATYPEKAVPYEFYDTFLDMCKGYPNGILRSESGEVVGFGMLRRYSSMPTFSETAEITYFIKHEYTAQGYGTALLQYLIDEGKKKGINNILASVSSLNEGSRRFHKRHGFVECGRFRNIGRKQGQVFDVVYYQRVL